MLSEDGSFSGHEHNRFYLNLGNGRFVDASSVAGLDSDRDGRAFATLDFDGDGDLDLLVKNRNSPQLVVLENRSAVGRSVTFELAGTRSNRDAIGAELTLITAGGQRRKYVQAGAGFLSQSSRRVFFGLGAADEIREVHVRWPSGREERFAGVPANHLIILREGETEFSTRAFRTSRVNSAAPAPRTKALPEPAEAASGLWLLDPVPVPELAATVLNGGETRLTAWRGRPLLLNFWATWCAPCQQELQEWSAAYEQLRMAGAEVLAVSLDEPGTEGTVRRFAAERGLPFPVLLPRPESVHAYNVLHRNLLPRKRDLQVPTTFLLDAAGHLVKLYRGITPPELLLRDLKNLPATAEQRLRAALPFGGQFIGQVAPRDYIALASAFVEAGATEAGQPYFERAVGLLESLTRREPGNAKFRLNLGKGYLYLGQNSRAAAALEHAVQLDLDSADAHFALGVAQIRLGRDREALASLERTIALDPTLADAYYNLSIVCSRLGRPECSVRALEKLVEITPYDADALDKLGLAYATTGAVARAADVLERAVNLQPENAEALRHLGTIYFQTERLEPAAEILERARQLAPANVETCLLLAGSHARLRRFDRARWVLRELLKFHPQEPRATELLREIDRVAGPGSP